MSGGIRLQRSTSLLHSAIPHRTPAKDEEHAVYAIIEDSGTQIRVMKGDEIELDLRTLDGDAKSIVFDRVLALGTGDGKAAKFGMPYVSGAKVSAEVLGEVQGDKLRLAKYKRRKGYRRQKGHRQPYLRVRITEIAG